MARRGLEVLLVCCLAWVGAAFRGIGIHQLGRPRLVPRSGLPEIPRRDTARRALDDDATSADEDDPSGDDDDFDFEAAFAQKVADLVGFDRVVEGGDLVAHLLGHIHDQRHFVGAIAVHMDQNVAAQRPSKCVELEIAARWGIGQ